MTALISASIASIPPVRVKPVEPCECCPADEEPLPATTSCESCGRSLCAECRYRPAGTDLSFCVEGCKP